MNQQNMGKFIAELRKQEQLTQKELADRLGVSDKTISKWECGNGIPDITYLEDLCKALHVNVNELLAGERLISQEAYSEKAEANIMDLMKENKGAKKAGKHTIIGVILMALLLLGLFYSPSYGNGYMELVDYWDAHSLLAEVGICICLTLICGARTKRQICDVIKLTVYPSAVVVIMIKATDFLQHMTELSQVGPALAAIFLSLLYASILYLITAVVSFKLEHELDQKN